MSKTRTVGWTNVAGIWIGDQCIGKLHARSKEALASNAEPTLNSTSTVEWPASIEHHSHGDYGHSTVTEHKPTPSVQQHAQLLTQMTCHTDPAVNVADVVLYNCVRSAQLHLKPCWDDRQLQKLQQHYVESNIQLITIMSEESERHCKTPYRKNGTISKQVQKAIIYNKEVRRKWG